MIAVTPKRMRKAGSPVPPHVAAIAEEKRKQRQAAHDAQQEQRDAELAEGMAPVELSDPRQTKRRIRARHYRGRQRYATLA